MQIDKNIPLPSNRKFGLTAILRKLEIHDSVVIPLSERHLAAPTAKQIGIKITTSKISDTDARVWRVT